VDEDHAAAEGPNLARARDGDRNAFAEIVVCYKDGLVNYLTRMTGSREEAEDIAQETFLRLVERSGNYEEQGKLKAYIFRTATNLLKSRARQLSRRRALRSIFLSPNGGQAPPGQQREILQNELHAQLQSALKCLPVHYRLPVVLFDIEEWSYNQIADVLRCREGTVKSRIFRGRKMLKKTLEPYWREKQA
jgi:RNA polymerase sigma-70 factor (ECF subfamily)